jgi:hypothetical protein
MGLPTNYRCAPSRHAPSRRVSRRVSQRTIDVLPLDGSLDGSPNELSTCSQRTIDVLPTNSRHALDVLSLSTGLPTNSRRAPNELSTCSRRAPSLSVSPIPSHPIRSPSETSEKSTDLPTNYDPCPPRRRIHSSQRIKNHKKP